MTSEAQCGAPAAPCAVGCEPGAPGAFTVNGEDVTTQARVTLQPGDLVRLDLPGGGGYGAPDEIAVASR